MEDNKTIYISLPMTGHSEKDIRARIDRLKELLELTHPDCTAISPYEAIESYGLPRGMTYGECMGADIAFIINRADTVLFAEGYETSKGCMLEWTCASVYDKQMLFESDLRKTINQ